MAIQMEVITNYVVVIMDPITGVGKLNVKPRSVKMVEVVVGNPKQINVDYVKENIVIIYSIVDSR